MNIYTNIIIYGLKTMVTEHIKRMTIYLILNVMIKSTYLILFKEIMFNHILTDVIEMITTSSISKQLYEEIKKIIPKLNEKYYKDRILDKLSESTCFYTEPNIYIKYLLNKTNNIRALKCSHRSYNKPSVIYKNGNLYFDYDLHQYRDYDLPTTIHYDGVRIWFNRCDPLPRLIRLSNNNRYIYEFKHVFISYLGYRKYIKRNFYGFIMYDPNDKIDIFNFI